MKMTDPGNTTVQGTSPPAVTRRGNRTLSDYVGAVYPCTVFELKSELGLEYSVCSDAIPSSIGCSDNSAVEALDDLRKRIETDIIEIIIDGRSWWQSVDDNLLVPLPHELQTISDNIAEGFACQLEAVDVEILATYDATVTVFPSGVPKHLDAS